VTEDEADEILVRARHLFAEKRYWHAIQVL
jgi:hypothetical protein